MKKNFIKSTMIAAVAIFAGYNVYQSNVNAREMSDIMLANVEALAQTENSYTGLRYQAGEHGTGGCINCPEPKDTNCTCK